MLSTIGMLGKGDCLVILVSIILGALCPGDGRLLIMLARCVTVAVTVAVVVYACCVLLSFIHNVLGDMHCDCVHGSCAVYGNE